VSNAGRRSPSSERRRKPPEAARNRFYLYLEGPGDQEILRSWARRLSHPLEKAINESSVIMGGRRPARALEHFRARRDEDSSVRGVCVLDHDDREEPVPRAEPGLEFFTWPRRHIESYLLVAPAIRRHTRNTAHLEQIERFLDGRDLGPVATHAKSLLGRHGDLSKALGQPIWAAGVAQAMRREEIHEDVHTLFACICHCAAVPVPETMRAREPDTHHARWQID